MKEWKVTERKDMVIDTTHCQSYDITRFVAGCEGFYVTLYACENGKVYVSGGGNIPYSNYVIEIDSGDKVIRVKREKP